MGTIQNARGVLSDAEASLRRLMELALSEQRYTDVAEIAGLADGIARLLQGRVFDERPVIPANSVPATPSAPIPIGARSHEKKSKSTKREYPRFERDGDKLVKIGWSKTNKETYEHRAPHESVVAFARHLTGNVTEGKVFAVEDLLPVSDFANGGEIPAYQVYLVLAWLQHVGAVAKKGRNGYMLRRGGLGNGTLDSFWANLPTRSA